MKLEDVTISNLVNIVDKIDENTYESLATSIILVDQKPVISLVDYARDTTIFVNQLKKEAIENGFAQYNPTTGEFEFI